MDLFQWILSGAFTLILFLLGAEQLGMIKLSGKFDEMCRKLTAEINDLKIGVISNYASRTENTNAHKELWAEINKSREDIARMRGKMNGD